MLFRSSLGNLESVGGHLDLYYSTIKSLGQLQYVGKDLDLEKSDIESLGDLKLVGGSLDLENTLISKKYSGDQIRKMVKVKGTIFI